MTSQHEDLALAFELADAADAVSTAHFRSEELRTVTKDDGTPVSEVDLAVEQAMLALVQRHRPADAAIGEEVGPQPAPAPPAGGSETGGWGAPRRWIFDGIDGTHNYAAGRTGWGTIIALQDGDGVALAMITAPRFGQRWWATRGGGAWTAPYQPDGTVDRGAASRLACSATERLDDASVIVIPFQGFLLGWRNAVAMRFTPPAEPRSHCFALDAAMVAEGRLDAAIMTFGSVWDHAGPSLLVTEAGGVFRDAWGGTRLDSTTAVHTNPALVDQVLAVLAELRPPIPDEPLLARKVSTPIGTAEEQEADPWRRFGLRPMPSMSARVHVTTAAPAILEIVDERAAELARPFLGVTTDGTVRPRFGGGRPGPGSGPGTAAVAEAAQAFLAALTPEQRSRATFAFDADEWRMWINVHMNHFRHGLMLEDLGPAQREAALDIVRASLSGRGFHQARSIMRLNELLAEITGDHEAFGEWPYFVSIFGDPSGPAPWGWQIDGHHLCVNAVAVDGHLVTTPTFMGAEPRRVNLGPLAGISLFDPEESLGLDLIRSLDQAQRDRAVVYPSIHPDHIPALLQNAFDGRMVAGAFHDNLVAPYQGVAGADLSDAQRKLLVSLAATYVGWTADAHAAGRLAEVEAHLDETWFSWYGGTDDTSPFYYRVHSPVLLVEFDHHPGVALDNEEPSRHHVHTVVRTPNGGDYGTDLLGPDLLGPDLLADHHARFDHRQGRHTPRN